MNRSRLALVFSIFTLILTLAVAAGIDRLLDFLRQENARTFALNQSILWAYSLGNLLLGGLLLALALFALLRRPSNPWVAAVYLLVGLVISLSPVLYFTPLGQFGLLPYLSPQSFLFLSGGFVACTGLVLLIDPFKKIRLSQFTE